MKSANTPWKEIERTHKDLIADVERTLRPLIDSLDVDAIMRNTAYSHTREKKWQHLVETEKRRYLKALHLITANQKVGRVCDLGCFIPYLPLALAKLGHSVTIVDRYELYGRAFKESIVALGKNQGIDVVDLDMLREGFEPLGENDLVLLTAVVEHLNGSPRDLLRKAKGILAPDGTLLFEVPNIAEFVKRVGLLFGRSPLTYYPDYFHSDYPFTGHNHEMTVAEVAYSLSQAGFDIEYLDCYDYDPNHVTSLKGKLVGRLKSLIPLADKGQSIIAIGHPSSDQPREKSSELARLEHLGRTRQPLQVDVKRLSGKHGGR